MRKITTILILLAYMVVWIIFAATVGSKLTGAPKWMELAFYVVAGIAWIFPLRPLFRWMNSPRDE